MPQKFEPHNYKLLRLLKFIHDYKQVHPYSPDLLDMSLNVFGNQEQPLSKSVVNYYLDELEKLELISFLYNTGTTMKRYRVARTVHLTDRGKELMEKMTATSAPLANDVLKKFGFRFRGVSRNKNASTL